MEEKEKKKKSNGMEKVAAFIVDRRNLFFLLYLFAIVFSCFSVNWVEVENDITTYLPDTTETRQGLTVMDDNFTTYGTARVMVSNISYTAAQELADRLEEIDGVTSAEFDETSDHYSGADALFSVTFDGVEEDEISVNAMQAVRDALAGYDTYIDTQVGVDESADLRMEMVTILIVAAVIIVAVLTLTSRSYAEVPVLILTFAAAAVLNMGTNFLCGKISFISNSVTVVLQLALAIDYAIILCHRFSDEHETLPTREACIAALSKAIPEISSSSLTTICGLAALSFMHFRLGLDLATVLIKAIFLSLLSVFTLMPGLLMLFSKKIDATRHKKLIPNITLVGKMAIKTRYVVPPLFVVVIIGAFFLSGNCPYRYTQDGLYPAKLNERQIAQQKITAAFGNDNMVAVIVPAGDYESEKLILNDLSQLPGVKSTVGLANTEAEDGYMLADAVTPREFSEMVDLDYEVARLLYTAYAVNNDAYGEILNGIQNYRVPLFDMFLYLKDRMESDSITLQDDIQDDLDDLFDQLEKAQLQLQSDSYSRLVVYLSLPQEGTATEEFLDEAHRIVQKYYTGDTYIVGDATSAVDLAASFVQDNTLINILSALFVVIILLFTFQSAGLPILLILVIQGSIWINFSFPYLFSKPLYFLGYLIVQAIQMGANIDYAIVISSHYSALKQKGLPIQKAIIEALNEAFPTILTSGAILTAAGELIGYMTANPVIAAIGESLGRGTFISILLVLGVLPQILLLGDRVIEKTSFALRGLERLTRTANGSILIRGRVRGYVNGVLDAEVNGVLHGQFNAMIGTGTTVEETANDEPALPAHEEPNEDALKGGEDK